MLSFPQPSNLSVNMMPIVMGDVSTLPASLHSYIPMIKECAFTAGATVYLTVVESLVTKGGFNRRPGVHTDATNATGWGGGGWGGASGIYLASNDGACQVWEESVTASDVDRLGSLLSAPKGRSRRLEPNKMYHIGEYTPHVSLPSETEHVRQFFRLVGPEIGIWYAKHSTPNPFGVKPNAPVVEWPKF